MTTETMTIHEAMSELKVIESRITKAILACQFAVPNKHCNSKISGKPVDQFRDEQASNFQSVMDLINRRNAIKRAVVKSNAAAIVTVCGKTYTVAEAIDMKNNGTNLLIRLYEKMTTDLARANREIEMQNGDALMKRADDHIRVTYGNQTDVKGVTEEIRRDRENFITQQTYDLIQPAGMDVAAKAKNIEEEVSQFLMKVDAALSVSNATTTITVEY